MTDYALLKRLILRNKHLLLIEHSETMKAYFRGKIDAYETIIEFSTTTLGKKGVGMTRNEL